jgi:succinoglycan biosynthesis protein ExoM
METKQHNFEINENNDLSVIGSCQKNTSKTILCSVCIATYRRPKMLENLLISLEKQILPENLNLEVIVVDNDIEKSAEAVFHKYQNSGFFKILYFTQPEKNISLTRNVAVHKASGDYILFIDDDEVASSMWVYHLVDTIVKYNADGAIGPVIPGFHQNAPNWIKKREFFYDPILSTGELAINKYTSNCIVKTSLFEKVIGPFDPRYGVTGGEDTHLFHRIERLGARFVYCKEASVTEYLPFSRTRVSYLFIKALKGGNAHTRRIIEFAETKKICVRFLMICKSFGYGSISIIFMTSQCLSPVSRTKWLMKFASNIGRFIAAIGWYYKGYK